MAAAPNEFADWLSPILVKELRQGLRARVFVGSFMLLQVAMVFLALFGVSAAATGGSTEGYSGIYWTMVAVPLLIIMPGSGLAAISAERKANTLELVFLSRLTARRILLGKWVAILLQSVLLVCAVVPYAVLRYFLGGVDVQEELALLAAILYFSALFCGVAVGISPLPLGVTRTIFILVVVFSMQGVPAMIAYRAIAPMMGGPSFGSFPAFSVLSAFALGVPIALAVLYLFWEYGAGLIAPPVENHSTPVRLLALGTLLLGAGAAWLFPAWKGQTLGFPIAMGLVICIGLICERPRLIPALYRPFVRRGFAGRAAGLLLYPGWASGVLFTTVWFALGALFYFMLLIAGRVLIAEEVLRYALGAVAALGVLLLPVAFIRFFFPKVPRPFLTFFLVQLGFVSLFAVTAVVRAFSPALDPAGLFRIFPAYALVTADDYSTEAPLRQFGPAAGMTVLALLMLLWRMRETWRAVSACERQAEALP